MFINQKKSTSLQSRGFTLIEMLVVIAILASLAAIAFPLTRSVINKGKVTDTKMRMQELESAINSYNNDNGHLPHAANYPSNESISDADLTEIVTILLNKESGSDPVNSTGKKYLLMQDAKNSRNGVVYSDNNKNTIKSITDAWGNAYEVLIDYDLDGEITKQIPDESNSTIKGKSVIIISSGVDGDFDTDDDVYSWK